MIATKPTQFKVRTSQHSRLYVMVSVWPTLKSMRSRVASMPEYKRSTRYLYGCFIGQWNMEPRDMLGALYLSRKYLSMFVVSHEFTHATIHYQRRLGLDMADPPGPFAAPGEEKFCDVQGYMMNAFALGCHDRGL
jgi:hypothetical protein